MKICAIDIGTNSTRYLIAEFRPDTGIAPISEGAKITRLGKDVDAKGHLLDSAMDRTLTCIKNYMEHAASEDVQRFNIVATSALRDAANKDVFIGKLKDIVPDIRIISGQEEAKLTYEGAALFVSSLSPPCVIIDIGGGSTELIFADNNAKLKTASIDIGAVRLTERFIMTDPIADDEKREMEGYIDSQIAALVDRELCKKVRTAPGVGGTITTAAAMILRLSRYTIASVHLYELSFPALLSLLTSLEDMTLQERRTVAGLKPQRADIIIAGLTILKVIMKRFQLESLTVSHYGILAGLVLEAGKRLDT